MKLLFKIILACFIYLLEAKLISLLSQILVVMANIQIKKNSQQQYLLSCDTIVRHATHLYMIVNRLVVQSFFLKMKE